MEIKIKRKPLTIREERKLKLAEIENIYCEKRIQYDWNLKSDSDESFYDFQMFCISIVKDLISNNFNTNEKGLITYDVHITPESTLKDLQNLFYTIEELSIKNKNEKA